MVVDEFDTAQNDAEIHLYLAVEAVLAEAHGNPKWNFATYADRIVDTVVGCGWTRSSSQDAER